MEENNKNMEQENKDEKAMNKKPGVIAWIKKKTDQIPTPVKYGLTAVGGALLTLGGMYILGGKSDDTPTIPDDVIDVACEVKDVIPEVTETVVEEAVETGEF